MEYLKITGFRILRVFGFSDDLIGKEDLKSEPMSSNEVLTVEKDSEVCPYKLLATTLNDFMDLFKIFRVMKFH